MICNLDENWQFQVSGDKKVYNVNIPSSLYKTLLDHDMIEDPYFGENDSFATEISRKSGVYKKKFIPKKELFNLDKIFLKFHGIDTLSEVFLNGKTLGKTNNMHRIWEFDVTKLLKDGENEIEVRIDSPILYAEEKYKERKLWGVDSTIPGYQYIRKAHYMYGWDWGPKLPDLGIWRSVELVGVNKARIHDVYVSQEHKDGNVDLEFKVNTESFTGNKYDVRVTLTAPNGNKEVKLSNEPSNEAVIKLNVENPEIWWPNGFGKQPLYNVLVEILSENEVLDSYKTRIGLRTLTVSRDADKYGKEFCFVVNGKKIFAMGANYIPEDQIASTCTKERTYELLEQCIKANYNFIRVWGGGYYPDDWFFDFCDENGLIVWLDFMFACAGYYLKDGFKENIIQEEIDNVIRLRNRASLGLWCGNNENQVAWESWTDPRNDGDDESRADYHEQFEKIMPEVLKEYDPNRFYWPSSPSSEEGVPAHNPDDGDCHYWNIWHGLSPIEDFRKNYFRFCSEYGFESLPNYKTVRYFAKDEKLNLSSPVVECHQKCPLGNEKMMFYMAQMVKIPDTFEGMCYASQLLQADCIRSNVEHMRRNRGRCMGSAYWQVNDSNPVISWSSIDYFNRWKALHYYAKRFYAPVLISINDEDCIRPVINVCNERLKPLNATIKWNLRDNTAKVIKNGEILASLDELSALDIVTLDLSKWIKNDFDKRKYYLEYAVYEGKTLLSKGSTLLVRPKSFEFIDPKIEYTIKEKEDKYVIKFKASAYAKSVCLDLEKEDCTFSDNWFDIHGNEPVEIEVLKNTVTGNLNLKSFKSQLTIKSNFDY